MWSADWPKDLCEMVDSLSFPAPAFAPDGTVIRKGDIVSINRSLLTNGSDSRFMSLDSDSASTYMTQRLDSDSSVRTQTSIQTHPS